MIIDFSTGKPAPENEPDKIVPLSKQPTESKHTDTLSIHVHVKKVADLLHSAVPSTLKTRRLSQQRTSLPHYVEIFARFLRDSADQ